MLNGAQRPSFFSFFATRTGNGVDVSDRMKSEIEFQSNPIAESNRLINENNEGFKEFSKRVRSISANRTHSPASH